MIRPRSPRVVPTQRSLVLDHRRGVIDIRYTVTPQARYIFNIDVYGYGSREHPSRHLGWWRFALDPAHADGRLSLTLDPIDANSVALTINEAPVPPLECWYNSDFAFDPLLDLQLVTRDPSGDILRLESVLLKCPDRDILRAFYERQYATDGYSSAEDAPFLEELHQYKLTHLKELFLRYIPPAGRALDVGCGRSLFADLQTPFPFSIHAGDLNYDSVHTRASEVPTQTWSTFDASALPFRDAQFDALFAGEVIEHVPDVEATLQEWWRILKVDGIAIITTPNRERLVAVANRRECPYSVDHLNELSYRQLTQHLLPRAGFAFVEQSCLYLELWLRHLFTGQTVEDFLQREGNQRRYVWLMRRLFPLGRYLPRWSLGLVIVARKRPGRNASRLG